MGVAVSVNKNEANTIVSGQILGYDEKNTPDDLTDDTKGDVTIAADLAQNTKGRFIGLMAAQSLAGSVAGSGGKACIAGAVSVLVSNADRKSVV